MSEQKEFHIGLCLAGAISAGAYTAGVIDYLIEALEDWERRKQEDTEGKIPSHRVKLSVIGGASAGGMTGLITALALLRKFAPMRDLGQLTEPMAASLDNPLYQAWVDLLQVYPSTNPSDMLPILLQTSDLKQGKVQSMLNSDFVEHIADRIVEKPAGDLYWRPYVQDPLPVFCTLSNLRGMEYQLDFNLGAGEKAPYRIQDHRDYACFSFSPQGKEKKGWEAMLPYSEESYERYKKSAMATGAFPIGLRPVELPRNLRMLSELPWLEHINEQEFGEKGSKFSTIVDGGMINNEPFEKVREELDLLVHPNESDKEEKEEKNQSYRDFKSTVILVDPFPSESGAVEVGNSILDYAGNLLGALVNQARVKPDHLKQAIKSNQAGQYLISPTRYLFSARGEEKVEGAKAIACGSLEGFGGFVSKEFRIHDFFLGRANCEKFLRDYFTVPEESGNEIFKQGYAGLSLEERGKFYSKKDQSPGLQIIPIFTDRTERAYMPRFATGDWPKISENELRRHDRKLESRVDEVISRLFPLKGIDWFLLWAGRKFFLKPKISGYLMESCIRSLRSHFQIR